MSGSVLCVDIGTSSLKAALLGDTLRSADIFVSRAVFPSLPHDFSNPYRAGEWISALAEAVSELKAKKPDFTIEAVCVSGNGPTIVGEDGCTLMYNEPFFIHRRDCHLRKQALKSTKSMFIPRLVAFKALHGESWRESEHIFGAPEFVIHALTGNAVTILPEKRFLGAYWTQDELKACGFTETDTQKLPPFVCMGSLAGKVSGAVAAETGLPEGTPVFCGASDFVVALIGTGTIFPGKLCDRAGTSEGLNLCTRKPIFAEGLRTMPSVIPDLWNVSYLLNSSQSARGHRERTTDSRVSASYFDELSYGINLLREVAIANGETFPDTMTITGGQALDLALVAQKEAAVGLKIKIPPCADAELVGDLILARVALGDYRSIEEAVFAIIG